MPQNFRTKFENSAHSDVSKKPWNLNVAAYVEIKSELHESSEYILLASVRFQLEIVLNFWQKKKLLYVFSE